jgi:hypothetical protein
LEYNNEKVAKSSAAWVVTGFRIPREKIGFPLIHRTLYTAIMYINL